MGDQTTHDLLDVLALFERPASFDELRALCGPTEEVRQAVLELEEQRLIAASSHGFMLAADTMRRGRILAMGLERRRALHAEIFTLLRRRFVRGIPVSARELARHALAGAQRPLELPTLIQRALEEAVRAGDQEDAARWSAHRFTRAAEEAPVYSATLRRGPGRPRYPTTLTPREDEVVRLARQGCKDAEIAAALVLSVGTVRKHLENAKRKLGVSRKIELVTHSVRD